MPLNPLVNIQAVPHPSRQSSFCMLSSVCSVCLPVVLAQKGLFLFNKEIPRVIFIIRFLIKGYSNQFPR